MEAMLTRIKTLLTRILTAYISTLVLIPLGVFAQDSQVELEKCFGVVLKGLDDGMESGPNKNIPGTSTIDYDGNAYKYVKKGSCVNIKTPKGSGSLEPVK